MVLPFFSAARVGPVLVSGPLFGWIVFGLEVEPVLGGLGALGAALASVGIRTDRIVEYEAELKSGRLLTSAPGATDE